MNGLQGLVILAPAVGADTPQARSEGLRASTGCGVVAENAVPGEKDKVDDKFVRGRRPTKHFALNCRHTF